MYVINSARFDSLVLEGSRNPVVCVSFLQYITHAHFYKIMKNTSMLYLDAPDCVISGKEPSSEMLTSRSQIPE